MTDQELLLLALYSVGPYGAYLGSTLRLRTDPKAAPSCPSPYTRRWPRATPALLLVVAIPTSLQFAFPALLGVLGRDPALLAAGQWWRLVTPLVVQDGGVPGNFFNLVTLMLVGSVAERTWGSARCLLIFLIGGVVSEAIALAWQPFGAGNSVANFALAGSIAAAGLRRDPPRLALALTLLALGADAWLLMLRNIHGAGALMGVAIGAAFLGLDRVRQATPH